MKTVGERIREWRRSKGYTQAQCAMAVGVSQPTWFSYEQLGILPSDGHMHSLVKLTKGEVDMQSILREKAEKKKKGQRA